MVREKGFFRELAYAGIFHHMTGCIGGAYDGNRGGETCTCRIRK